VNVAVATSYDALRRISLNSWRAKRSWRQVGFELRSQHEPKHAASYGVHLWKFQMSGRVRESHTARVQILVVGATGRTGTVLTQDALAAGHTVTAFVRTPEAMITQHERLRVLGGDVLDQPSVERAVAGQEAVLWVAGGRDRLRAARARSTLPSSLCTTGTRHIISAMRQHGVRRFICLSSWGVGDSRARVPLVFGHFLFPLLLKEELADKERQEQLVRASGLDWTIVRPARLVDAPRTGTYRIGISLSFPTTAHIARGDLSTFLLRQLDDPGSIGCTVEVYT
jgi:putative NADH-flavin reductase